MRKNALGFGLAAVAALALAACGGEQGQSGGNDAQSRQAGASDGAEQTIGAGLDQNSRFFQAAKAAGLDSTLAGPGPYTVLAPDDAAFGRSPAGAADDWARPEGRSQLTSVLTYHILPGTVLAEDIGKAIDNAKGEAILATMGGGTVTATRADGKIVLTDGSGNKATVARPDQKFSNGVVHYIDGVLTPAPEQGGAQAPQG